jgi:hypothetical protein
MFRRNLSEYMCSFAVAGTTLPTSTYSLVHALLHFLYRY